MAQALSRSSSSLSLDALSDGGASWSSESSSASHAPRKCHISQWEPTRENIDRLFREVDEMVEHFGRMRRAAAAAGGIGLPGDDGLDDLFSDVDEGIEEMTDQEARHRRWNWPRGDEEDLGPATARRGQPAARAEGLHIDAERTRPRFPEAAAVLAAAEAAIAVAEASAGDEEGLAHAGARRRARAEGLHIFVERWSYESDRTVYDGWRIPAAGFDAADLDEAAVMEQDI